MMDTESTSILILSFMAATRSALDETLTTLSPCQTGRVLGEVAVERARQDAKWGRQNHPWRKAATESSAIFLRETADAARNACEKADKEGRLTWWHILAEEFWEATAETDWPKAREELIQIAAVAVAAVENGDERAEQVSASQKRREAEEATSH